ncbi:jg26169, partial [Pararge aegeria aegeria]
DRVGRRIIKAFRENPSNESLEYGHDVTFKEFALFLTNNSKDLADIVNNEHWQPITTLCHPCLIKYTLVGRYGMMSARYQPVGQVSLSFEVNKCLQMYIPLQLLTSSY